MHLSLVAKLKVNFYLYVAFLLGAVDRRVFSYIFSTLIFYSLYLAFSGTLLHEKRTITIQAALDRGLQLYKSGTYESSSILFYIEANKTIVDDYFEKTKSQPPAKKADVIFPYTTASVILVTDKLSDSVLYAKNSDQKMLPASTAKLATALVAFPLYDEDTYLKVPQFCTDLEGQKVGLLPGYEYKVSDLYYALLVASSSEAACVFSVSKISYADFVRYMNNVMFELGATSTSLSNPVGLDGITGDNYTTASDLYLLAKKSSENSFLKSVYATKDYEFTDKENKTLIRIATTNKLLGKINGASGIKTGTTLGAGEVLIFEYNPTQDTDIVIIVMNSKDRFTDTENILNWVLESYLL